MDPLTLGGYHAQQCARVTHNLFSPVVVEPVALSPERVALREAGIAFEAAVFDELRSQYHDSGALLVLDADVGRSEQQRATRAAMDAGVDVIAGAWLPEVNSRVGRPDVLIRYRNGYLPVDIKNHRTLSAAKTSEVQVSTLSAPDQLHTFPGYSDHGARWRDDVMQLAHYTRMLQELGYHPGLNRGGIIGSSDLTEVIGQEHAITWYDLDAEAFLTYSASDPEHRKKRSALQRYDHEFTFRLDVARAAASGRELVRPYRIADCDSCDWFEHCATVAGEDDASFALETGHLNVREWQYLYRHCGDGTTLSVAQLARVDPDHHAEAFRIQSVRTQKPEERLAKAVRRARMSCAGIDYEQHRPGHPTVPSADIEVDFDIEWDADSRIYQWGLRIRDGQDDATAHYDPVVSFEPLDEHGEAQLADEFVSRIRQLREQAAREDKSLAVFHWHHAERSRTRRFPGVVEVLDGLTHDLHQWFEAEYFARTSSSIKSVAGYFGFEWDVDDAGGLASQLAIDVARGCGPEADIARQWCLRYNECDVAAQAAIRDGLRSASR
ncbi:recombinase RecB [Mycobacterium sp. pW045]|uniref:recombinase RecB n=1 Tax=Mycobacterium sp. pW045 TaxID=3238984 RepID=UPI00351B640D